MNMQLAEQMAVAILRGDQAAAASLADMLRDEHGEGAKVIPPVKTLTVADSSRLRVLLTTHESLGTDVVIDDPEGLKDKVRAWLRGDEGTLILRGLNLTLYELPPAPEPLVGQPDPLTVEEHLMSPDDFERYILDETAEQRMDRLHRQARQAEAAGPPLPIVRSDFTFPRRDVDSED